MLDDFSTLGKQAISHIAIAKLLYHIIMAMLTDLLYVPKALTAQEEGSTV